MLCLPAFSSGIHYDFNVVLSRLLWLWDLIPPLSLPCAPPGTGGGKASRRGGRRPRPWRSRGRRWRSRRAPRQVRGSRSNGSRSGLSAALRRVLSADPLPPRRVLFVVGRPESDVMHAATSQVGPRRAGTFDHPHRRPRTATPNLEGHRPATALRDLAQLSEAEHFGEHPGGGIRLPNRQVDCRKTPDPHLSRNGALCPRNTALYSFPLVS